MRTDDPGGVVPTPSASATLFDPLFTSDAMAAATGADAWVAALLAFERELATAQADLGMVPPAAARAAADATRAVKIDPESLGRAARDAGNPVVPLVRAVRDAATDDMAVHRGATSQDAMDTAAMLVAERACRIVLADLDAAARACAALADGHRATVMTGRTLLQPAVPVTFGLKAAGWLVALCEAADATERVRRERLALQLGGAAGTMAAFGAGGPELATALATRLGLADPLMPWHADRSRLVELGAALVLVANAAAKVALDVVLLAQAEVGEATEAPTSGRGGSSTMPQKANPVTSVRILATARRAHAAAAALAAGAVHDHERAATGGWHAEWQPFTDLLRAAGGCAAGVAGLLEGLEVDGSRMEANVEATNGVLVAERIALALSATMGRREAADVVARASRAARAEDRPLRDVLSAMPELEGTLAGANLDDLCDPRRYLGASDALVDRALARHAASRDRMAARS